MASFAETFCRVSRGDGAGQPVEFRRWQRKLIDDLFEVRPDGLRRYRRGLLGMPRKNGKSLLGSVIALYGLFADGEPGAEVYSCAGDRDQARIVFGEAKRMVEADPELSTVAKVYRDAIEVPDTNSVYRALSAEAGTKEGLNPSLVIFDEVHVQPSDALWDVMTLGSGTRRQPLVLGITTAGFNKDSLCYRQYEYGRRVESGETKDPSFFFRWWEPPDAAADYRTKKVWKQANPALGDFLRVEDMEVAARQTPEAAFRRYRLNQWTATRSAWLPAGMWDGLVDAERSIPDGTEVVLGFDGSFNNDSTALVVVQPGEIPHLDVVEAWERPTEAQHDWKVPVLDVEAAIRQACRRWKVREIACDTSQWRHELQILEEEGYPIVDFPQSVQRMRPATQHFYEAVVNHRLSHSGDPRLARHVENCVIKIDYRGQRITKEHSTRKIDLAVASVMAVERASVPAEVIPEARVLDLRQYV